MKRRFSALTAAGALCLVTISVAGLLELFSRTPKPGYSVKV